MNYDWRAMASIPRLLAARTEEEVAADAKYYNKRVRVLEKLDNRPERAGLRELKATGWKPGKGRERFPECLEGIEPPEGFEFTGEFRKPAPDEMCAHMGPDGVHGWLPKTADPSNESAQRTIRQVAGQRTEGKCWILVKVTNVPF